MSEHLKTTEVAKRLGLSEDTIRRLCSDGYFPNAWRLGGKSTQWRIPETDVDAFIERKKRQAAEG